MSTGERSAGRPPMYARLLRLRRIRITGLVSFLLMECTIAVAVLLALAELVSWWAVPLLPVLVAAVVKINDMVGGPAVRALDEAGRWEEDPDGDGGYREAPERYEQDGYDHEAAWPAERTAAAHEWYEDNPTQEIFLPPAVTGRPRQRMSGDVGEYDAEPAYAGSGAYNEQAYAAGHADRGRAERAYADGSRAHANASRAHAYTETGHADADWARRAEHRAEPGSDGWDDAYAAAVSASGGYRRADDVAADRPSGTTALTGAGRHSGTRTASGRQTRGGGDTASGRGADVSGAHGAGTPSSRVPSGESRGASRPADYWTRAAGVDAGRTTGASRAMGVPGGPGGSPGRGHGAAGDGMPPGLPGGMPPGTPGSAAPRRAQLFGAAVRRSMAAQAQQLGGGAVGGSTGRNRSGAGHVDTGSGRHARGESGTGSRQVIRLNERGFGRLRDA